MSMYCRHTKRSGGIKFAQSVWSWLICAIWRRRLRCTQKIQDASTISTCRFEKCSGVNLVCRMKSSWWFRGLIFTELNRLKRFAENLMTTVKSVSLNFWTIPLWCGCSSFLETLAEIKNWCKMRCDSASRTVKRTVQSSVLHSPIRHQQSIRVAL